MNLHQLPGDVTVALTHLALCGLAAIADDASGTPSRLWWTDDQVPVPTLTSVLDSRQLAEAVHAHAVEASSPASWLNQREATGSRAGAGLFTARAKVPTDPAEWGRHAMDRRAARRSLPASRLDGRLILGLGEPAWWRWERNANRPDEGASRWEMKTRNQGQEFLVDRLVPIARALADRTPQQILDGLTGHSVVDEPGKGSPDSRTATGLTTPGPADAAIAWCALWGLSTAPPIPRRATISRTPGVWPGERLHPTTAGLPVFTEPVSATRFSQILLSAEFDTAAAPIGTRTGATQAPTSRDSARAWLLEQGVRAIVVFPVLKAGTSSAPERQLLAGKVEVLR